MKIAIIGGTGKEGSGLALRWARVGHEVVVGSRDTRRGEEGARTLEEKLTQAGAPGHIRGGDNAWAVGQAEIALLAVPYSSHRSMLIDLKPALSGKILVDITVPLAPPKVTRVHLPEGKAAALEAQEILGAETRVVATMHHISAVHLAEMEHWIDSDVLVCGDDEDAKNATISLIQDLGMRGLDAGPLQNAVALESFTPVLLYMNKRYKSRGCGLRITGIPG